MTIESDSRCELCNCLGDPDDGLTTLWECEDCGGIFHAGCSGASDDYPDLCDDCANDHAEHLQPKDKS